MARMSIYVPDNLRMRIAAATTHLNWSRLFQDAAEAALLEKELCEANPLRLIQKETHRRTQGRSSW